MTPEELAEKAVPCVCVMDYTMRGRHAPQYPGGNCSDVREIVERAITAQRERDAQIVESHGAGHSHPPGAICEIDTMAKEIREGVVSEGHEQLITVAVSTMTDEQRLALFSVYCRHCGRYDADTKNGCNCMRDE